MPFTVSTTRFTQYVQLVVGGTASIRNFVDLVALVEQETVLWSDRLVLADLRDVQGELTPAEQVFLGELVAQNLPHIERVASLVPAERITRHSETAAQELGMRLRVFTSKDEAVAWLKSAPPARAAKNPMATQPGTGP